MERFYDPITTSETESIRKDIEHEKKILATILTDQVLIKGNKL